MTGAAALLPALATLVEELPEAAIPSLVDAIAGAAPGDWAMLRTEARGVLAVPRFREQVEVFITTWQNQAPDLPPIHVALAIQAAAYTLARQRRSQTIELVWSGPASGQPLRRTAQVLQGLIDEAEHEVLIVSYAVYDIPEIGQALLRAAGRGVQLRLVIESSAASAGKVAYDGLAALGAQVAGLAQVYRWPATQRPVDELGRHGALHVKCAIADRRTMLISSANLTRYALDLNMELGVLIGGGPLPGQVVQHIGQLILRGVLVGSS